MSNYQHKEGMGTLFVNEDATETNKQPHFRGDAMYNGQLIKIAGWKGVTQGGAKKISIKVEPKTEENQSSNQPKQVQADSSW